MRAFVFAIALLAVAAAAPVRAALNVFACEPEWGALAAELGGERVRVAVATTALQDPHRIEARPSLLARARDADLLVCTGAELEDGWLPLLLANAGNARIQPGRPGHFMAAEHVPLIEKPARVDRGEGDVHAAGNPHIHTDPRNIAAVAKVLAARLSAIDPAGASEYARREADFLARWQRAIERWQAQAAPLADMAVVSQHRSFSYLYAWLRLREVAVLEPKPGIEPGAAHLQSVQAALAKTPARMVLVAAYQNPRPAQWLARQVGIPAVILPFTVGGTDTARDLFSLFDDTLARLLAAAGRR